MFGFFKKADPRLSEGGVEEPVAIILRATNKERRETAENIYNAMLETADEDVFLDFAQGRPGGYLVEQDLVKKVWARYFRIIDRRITEQVLAALKLTSDERETYIRRNGRHEPPLAPHSEIADVFLLKVREAEFIAHVTKDTVGKLFIRYSWL